MLERSSPIAAGVAQLRGRAEPPTGADQQAPCQHCGLPVGASTDGFCCTGCRVVHELLGREHLERYYELRGPTGVAVPSGAGRADHKWLEPIEARVREGLGSVDLDVQGVHCSACVWLVERMFERTDGGLRVVVNPSIGRAHLLVGPSFDLRGFVTRVERFGYLFGPALKREPGRSNDLVVRLGITSAIAMNAMVFAFAQYAGLDEGPTYVLFQRLTLGLSVISVLVGGPVFFRSAWAGLRQGILHLDLPIALGIGLAFVGSAIAQWAGRDQGIFVDTLDVFIALMLAGRFVQERVLEKNRAALLADDGARGLLTRRRAESGLELVACTEIDAGDVLALAPGDVVPVDGRLASSAPASFSMDWINGESRPRQFEPGDVVPAGAFLASPRPVELTAQTAFAGSPLLDLLRTPRLRAGEGAMSTAWWHTLSKWYVVAVLTAASVGFAGWMLATGDLGRAIEVTAAVLIVTCPCAFGIATPIAYDLVQTNLRRAGLYVRSAGFLDRAARIRKVVFDKTGTLTTGALRIENPEAIASLPADDRIALATLAEASTHPKAVAVHRVCADLRVRALGAAEVVEHVGLGLEIALGGRRYRLGKPGWAADSFAPGDVVFGRDGALLASLSTDEDLRPDAASEIGALAASGYEVHLLSGDEPSRTRLAASRVGLDEARAHGGASAEQKAEWAAAHDDGDLLMIGDGINDSLAVGRATCSGTPAIDRPFMASRSDFYFTTPGLRPIRLALTAARALDRVRRRNLAIAITYNVGAVALAYAGLLSPLVCAVLMPASSLTTILATTFALNARRPLWRS
jgi:Cu2+-exporting ATPase